MIRRVLSSWKKIMKSPLLLSPEPHTFLGKTEIAKLIKIDDVVDMEKRSIPAFFDKIIE